MEMPNTVPQALTQELLQDKYDRAAEVSPVNYSFFMGASNHNLDEVLKTDPTRVCGIKVFMGSSTGDMLVDESKVLEGIFKEAPTLVATHCEDEATVRANSAAAKERHGEHVPIGQHPNIRSAEACYKSSSKAVELATKLNTQLHILHISTARELELFNNTIALEDKRITAEACVHHLWFSDADYESKGTHIKWNPAVKTAEDREHIRAAILDGRIDVVATDHAPTPRKRRTTATSRPPQAGPRPTPSWPCSTWCTTGCSRRKGRGPDGPSGGAPLPHGRPRLHSPRHEGRLGGGATERPVDGPRGQRDVQVRLVPLPRTHVQEPRARDVGERRKCGTANASHHPATTWGNVDLRPLTWLGV